MSGTHDEQMPEEDTPIVPVQFAGASLAGDEHDAARAKQARRGLVVAAAAMLFLAVLLVIFVLPRYVATTPDETAVEPVPEPVATDSVAQTTTEPEPLEPEAAAELRRTNQAQLEKLLELVSKLKQHNVTAWAEPEFAAAQALIGDGEKAYREQRYDDAEGAYQQALTSLQALDARTGAVVAEAVDRGFHELASRNAAAATKAFQFALAIAPGHERAEHGLARAGTLDQVLALINEAAGYEELKDRPAALQRYREALELDAEAPGASSAIARIEQQQREEAFGRAMSEGLDAVTNAALGDARAAFKRALKLKPGSDEAADALKQVENRLLADRIAGHLRRAAVAEREERWSEAATQYREAGKLDAELDGVAASASRADARAKLDQQLQAVLAQPQRLADDAVHREALGVLAAARREANPGSRLAAQIAKLDETIRRARTPIAITLVSDNLTNVTLYKVGALGRFDQRAVSIIPGTYVAVGKRDGFRDVRVEFEVSPARADAMITVRCEQKLAFGS